MSIKQFLEDNIFYETILIIWLSGLWKIYLTYRQIKLMKKLVKIPDAVVSLMTEEEYNKARSYTYEGHTFSIVKKIYSMLLDTALLFSYAHLAFWGWSIKIGSYMGITPDSEILISAICMLFINLFYTIFYMGLQVYNVFVIEQKYDFNKQTPMFFIKDQILKFIVMHVIAIPILCGVIWIVKNGSDYTFVYTWLFVLAASVFMIIIYPEVIAPLFDKYTPLEDGELKDSINALASSVNFPLYKLFIVNSSKRTSHNNAYLYGFYKHKRIVLFDTLVKEYNKEDKDEKNQRGCETDEIVAIVAHELGHWKYNHTCKGFVLSQVNLIIHFIVFSKFLYYAPMYAAFGFTDTKPILIGLLMSMYLGIPWEKVFHFITAIITRMFEYEADAFSVKLGYADALKRALIKLNKDNLAYPVFDKLYATWNHDHPSILERLEAIEKKD